MADLPPSSPIDPAASAAQAGLNYVSDRQPGLRRGSEGPELVYVGTQGEKIQDKDVLQRITALAIPPAWEKVWICPEAQGHLQATGYDEKGRKQYVYHPDWRQVRDASKYHRMISFGQALPAIRERVAADLQKHTLSREKVLATIVDLLEKTMIRIGNEEYAHHNKSYGLTTLQDRHLDIEGQTLYFHFRGKSGKYHKIAISDRRLARVVQRLQDLPGQELFQYVDEQGKRHDITSGDVNAYLREITGEAFTAKDFRTWKGTVLACVALQECADCTSVTEVKKNITHVVKEVAAQLGNTPAICRKCYIHPGLFERYAADLTMECVKNFTPEYLAQFKKLEQDEAVIMAFLHAHHAQESA